MTQQPSTLIVGLGYTGLRLARELKAKGIPVRGTTRSPEKVAAYREEGLETFVADLSVPRELTGVVPSEGVIVHTAPPVVDGGKDLGARRIIEAARTSSPKALIYLSTTGVYSERSGGWVTENSELNPSSPRAAPRLDAEQVFLEAAKELGVTGIVFRLSGIYGPGRGLAHRIREGRVKLWGGGINFLNRIHVDDVVRFILAAMQAPREASGIYNLADDRPATLKEYATWLAERIQVPVPPEAPANEAPPTLAGSKRICNRKAKETFGLQLRYPSFVEGFDE